VSAGLPSVGQRIELVRMGPDPDPIPPRTRGTVTSVHRGYGAAQIGVAWDNGRTLMLVEGEDVWRVLP
jgi:hypothetical protein